MMNRMLRLLLLSIAPPIVGWAQPQPNPVASATKLQSPEIYVDETVVFRLSAPKANVVTLNGSWLGGVDLPMTKGPDGLWTTTIGPLLADYASMLFK